MAAAKKTEETPEKVEATVDAFDILESRVTNLEKVGKAIQTQIKGLEQFGKELHEEIEVIKEALPKPAEKAEVKVLEIPTDTFKVGDGEFKFVKAKYRNRANKIVNSADALKNPAELEWLATVDAANIEKVK